MRHCLIVLLLAQTFQLKAQLTPGVYRFLSVQPVARVAALGGNACATSDSTDLSLVNQNPSLLSKEMHQQLSFNVVRYFADVQAGYFAYARHYDKYGSF